MKEKMISNKKLKFESIVNLTFVEKDRHTFSIGFDTPSQDIRKDLFDIWLGTNNVEAVYELQQRLSHGKGLRFKVTIEEETEKD